MIIKKPFLQSVKPFRLRSIDLIYSSIFLACTACNLQAANLPHQQPMASGWFVGASGGLYMPNLKDSHITRASDFGAAYPDNYAFKTPSNTGMFGIVAGYQWQRHTNWFPAYSVGLSYQVAKTSLNGVFYTTGLDDRTDYSYDVMQNIVILKLKAAIYRWHGFMPYASLGAGVAMNQAKNFTFHPAQYLTPFTNASNTNFAYSLGLGVDYSLTRHWQLGMEYQYLNTGKFSTGNRPSMPYPVRNDRLSNSLSANLISLTLQYNFT